MKAGVVLLAAACVVAVFAAGAADAASCTSAEKTARSAALASYRARISRDRSAYFRKHKSAAARAAFVKRQAARLAKLRAAAACTVTAPAPTPPAAPPPGTVTYTFDPRVDVATQAGLRAAVESARAYFTKIGATPGDADIRVYADAEAAAQGYAQAFHTSVETAREVWQFSTAVGSDGKIVINVGARGWTESDPRHRAKIVAHELFHLVQSALAGPQWQGASEPPPSGPRWLVEGAAEWIAFAAVVDSGLLSASAARSENLGNVKYTDGAPLREHETLAGFFAHGRAQYNLYYTAADYLIRATGPGAFIAFWRAIGTGTPWPAAFHASFGENVDAFYADFEAYRATLG